MSYLGYLMTLRYVLKFDNLHIMTQCAKIVVEFIAHVGYISIKRFLTFLRFLRF